MDDIRLKPCPRCDGLPVVLVRPFFPRPALRVECSGCGLSGPWIYFDGKGPIWQGTEKLLPGLGKARRQAAAAWNEGTCGSGGGASG